LSKEREDYGFSLRGLGVSLKTKVKMPQVSRIPNEEKIAKRGHYIGHAVTEPPSGIVIWFRRAAHRLIVARKVPIGQGHFFWPVRAWLVPRGSKTTRMEELRGIEH